MQRIASNPTDVYVHVQTRESVAGISGLTQLDLMITVIIEFDLHPHNRLNWLTTPRSKLPHSSCATAVSLTILTILN
jgi:hypothetical protein